MTQSTINTEQDLGSWGISSPGDVKQYAGNLVTAFCMSCRFSEFDLQAERDRAWCRSAPTRSTC
jgi:predicted NUDIX family NTP pyrophosphohydrolase